jgi:UDPglucose--hexose-1-phosphate uridylyltransferase
MAELRWHPLIKDWVMVVSQRQNRPQMPKDWCPFCKGSEKVPDDYIVLKYDNDFPALSLNPPVEDDVETELYKTLLHMVNVKLYFTHLIIIPHYLSWMIFT